MIPANFAVFRFPGYGPELSHGLAARTQDGRIVLAEAPTNPGTSLSHSIDVAIPLARAALGVEDEQARVYLWTPSDPLKPNALWSVQVRQGTPRWDEQHDWEHDVHLAGAVDALRRASSGA